MAWLRCHEALSQINSNAVKPWAASWAEHHTRKAIVTELTGSPATTHSHSTTAPHRGQALGRKLGGAPRQEVYGDSTHGTPRDKTQPHLVRLLRRWAHQQAITGQRLGIGVLRRWRQLLELGDDLRVRPTVLVGLGQPAPPDFIAKAQRPCGLRPGPCHQSVTSF